VQASKQGPSGGVATEAPSRGGGPEGDLAEFAKAIGPIKMPKP
jgi:hypothetical protein